MTNESTEPAIKVKLERAASSTKEVTGISVTITNALFTELVVPYEGSLVADRVAEEALRQFRALEAAVNPKDEEITPIGPNPTPNH